MSFAGFAFGAAYFGGAPATVKTITGVGACSLAPATCSGRGTAPDHGGTVTAPGGGGFGAFPRRKPGKRIKAKGKARLRPPMTAAQAMRLRRRLGVISVAVHPVAAGGRGVNVTAGLRDEGLLSAALAMSD